MVVHSSWIHILAEARKGNRFHNVRRNMRAQGIERESMSEIPEMRRPPSGLVEVIHGVKEK